MTTDAFQSYVDLITGVRRATQEKAAAAAQGLLAQAGLDEVAADAQQRVHRLTEEIVVAGRANRSMLQDLVRAEIEKALTRVGFARTEDLDQLRRESDELQARVDDLEADARSAGRPGAPAGFAEPVPTPAKEVPARKAAAKKAPAKKAAAKTAAATTPATRNAPGKNAAATTARKNPTRTTPTRTTPTRTTPTRTTPVRKTPAQKTSTKTAPAKKASNRS